MSVDLTAAVEAVARGMYENRRRFFPESPAWEDGDPAEKAAYREHVLPTVAGVAPHIEAAVREQIAAQFEKSVTLATRANEDGDQFDLGLLCGLTQGRAIARGDR